MSRWRVQENVRIKRKIKYNMAHIDNLIPHIIKWETGVRQLYGESLEHLFERARRPGYAYDPDDKGGATQSGVTIGTFKAYRKAQGKPVPTVNDLRNISYAEWRNVLKTFFWDKVNADAFRSEDVACMVVDWYWTSGRWAVVNTQKVLSVAADGVFGAKSLAALNGYKRGQYELWKAIRDARKAFYTRIAKGAQGKFLKGWLNRVNDLKWT